MELPEYILFNVPGDSNYVLETAFPNNIGKVVQIRNQDKAQDFNDKFTTYPVVRLIGMNIFIVHQGILNDNIHKWQTYDDQKAVTSAMAGFYAACIHENKIIKKTYKSNW